MRWLRRTAAPPRDITRAPAQHLEAQLGVGGPDTTVRICIGEEVTALVRSSRGQGWLTAERHGADLLVTTLTVDAKARRQGLGTALLQLTEDVARQLGCTRVLLRWRPGDDTQRPWAVRAGFTDVPVPVTFRGERPTPLGQWPAPLGPLDGLLGKSTGANSRRATPQLEEIPKAPRKAKPRSKATKPAPD